MAKSEPATAVHDKLAPWFRVMPAFNLSGEEGLIERLRDRGHRAMAVQWQLLCGGRWKHGDGGYHAVLQ